MYAIDQTGQSITLSSAPLRIVSVVPSQTELLFDLGLDEEVIGITKFCVHPEKWFRSKPRVGGTKTLDLPAIHALQPTLILANKEENTREQVEELQRHYPVWTSDIKNLHQALEMIRAIGCICRRDDRALEISDKISKMFDGLQQHPQIPEVAYLIWRNPYMAAGNDTFVHSIMGAAGFLNLFRDRPRYPAITIDDLRGESALPPCRLLLLSSEPYPFSEKHVAELARELPDTIIQLVDGEMFSWYGSRLLLTPRYIKELRDSLAISSLI